ncbi:hypothetical protein P3T73_03675 [Kiritimatiellota bacterium B12222]|nr:hypothetical protein P3T73_03675 [Kiritimatiellota bacterium B12222]
MKVILAVLLASALSTYVMADTVHQTSIGSAAYTGSGKSALDVDQMETKDVEGGEVARVTSGMSQWGFVTYWMGVPTPSGESIIRLKIWNTDEATATYAVYVSSKGGQEGLGQITIPEGSKPNSFVEVDFPVDSEREWSGIVLKKADKQELPSPWIQSVQVILP